MLAGFWVSEGRLVLRVGSAAEEVSCGRFALEEEVEVRFGRSDDEVDFWVGEVFEESVLSVLDFCVWEVVCGEVLVALVSVFV